MPLSDIEIARAAKIRPIKEIAQRLGIPVQATLPYGHTKCKITLDYIESLADRPDGKLILVTGITPTPPGEGKTTTTVGLGDGLNRIGKNAAICVREPSLGPSFGMKGGAAGGGYAQVIPMEDINLHFTGDFHAITTANNLLAALIDNHIKWENTLDIDPRRVRWRRVMDMNDRALRNIVTGLGPANGMVREAGFDITAASEVMAIFCLATDLGDLQRRIGDIIVAETYNGKLVTARELGADGAMTVLLRDALMPNMVQTLENNPAFIHGGPFANIAHGCNSAISTCTALKLCDYVVTEAGFGADLGAEKFFDIKCRKTGLTPDGAVMVATVRALKMHGGVNLDDLETEDVEAVRRGCANLARHIRNVQAFGVPVVVAINEFATDTEAELNAIREAALAQGVEVAICIHYTDGGAGAEDLARKVVALTGADHNNAFKLLYDDDMSLWDKVNTIATQLYGAKEIIADKKVRQQFAQFQRNGHGNLPVCMAKTQYSFSTDPKLKNAPSGHVLQIREIRLSAGAGFVVVICGSMMTMPGLPRAPSAGNIGIDENGNVFGLS